jgi:hypothetical protein
MDHSCEYLCSDLVTVTYEDGDGQLCQATANLEAISAARLAILLDEKPRLGSVIFLTINDRDVFGQVMSTVHDSLLGWLVNIALAPDSTWTREWFSPKHLVPVCSCYRDHVTPTKALALESAKVTEENSLVSFLALQA